MTANKEPGNKTVYIGISSDILHKGHLKIIDVGAELGDVIIGLLTDESIATYKRLPIIDWESRKALVEHLADVKHVVAQESLSYADNLRALKPDYVVHGDDWRSGTQAMVRAEVVKVLAEYGGELVEVPYTEGISGSPDRAGDAPDRQHHRVAPRQAAPLAVASPLHPRHGGLERPQRADRREREVR